MIVAIITLVALTFGVSAFLVLLFLLCASSVFSHCESHISFVSYQSSSKFDLM